MLLLVAQNIRFKLCPINFLFSTWYDLACRTTVHICAQNAAHLGRHVSVRNDCSFVQANAWLAPIVG